MPRDLFGDVTDPSVRVGSRKWHTVPLSLAAHAAVVLTLLIAPLLAVDALPLPDSIDAWVLAPALPEPPPPPPPPARPAEPPRVAASPDAAPVVAPSEITRESGIEPGFDNALGADLGVTDGLVTGLDGLSAAPSLPPPLPPAPVVVGGKIAPPQKVADAAPVYPLIAQSARVEGVVIIEATIGVDGHVTGARVLRSVPLLDQAALEAVRQWQYTPTRLNGTPVPVIMTVTVRFQLR